MNLTTVILTFNEERHVARAIKSACAISNAVVVVDSGSTDCTREIAASLGARVLQNAWTTHAGQFNWALDQLPPGTEWVLRLDADETVTPPLATEIARRLPALGPEVAGVVLSRRMAFLGRPIRWGGLFPIRIVRLFRHGKGCCEDRWMDEHILVDGATVEFRGEILDDNRQTLTWWTQKHNAYASREVVDLLNLEHGFKPRSYAAQPRGQAGLKRWLKEKFYTRLPGGVRASAYFAYRYVVRLGVLDGREGRAFHLLQGFWYRFLVDAKLAEVRQYMADHDAEVLAAIEAVLDIKAEEIVRPAHAPLPAGRRPCATSA